MFIRFNYILLALFLASCSSNTTREPASFFKNYSCKYTITNFFVDFKDKTFGGLHESQLLTSKLSPLKNRSVRDIEVNMKNFSIIDDLTNELPKSGVTKPYLLLLEDNIKAVWKPHKRIKLSNYRAEVLAYELDVLLDFNLVPPTVVRTIDGKLGSLQLFEEGISGVLLRYNTDNVMDYDARVLVHHNIKKQSLFDYLINNGDRHRANYLFTVNGRIISIDNGSSFTGQGYKMQSFEDRKSDIESFIQTDEGKKIIKRLRSENNELLKEQVGNYLGKKDSDSFFKRVNKILDFAN